MRRAAAITRHGALRGAASPALRRAGLWLQRLAGALALLGLLTTAARAHDGRHTAAAPAFAAEAVPGLSACAGRRGGPALAVKAAVGPALAVTGAARGGAPTRAAQAAPDPADATTCAGRSDQALAADAPDPAGLAPCEGHCCGGGLCCPAFAALADATPAALGRRARAPCRALGLAPPAGPDGPRRPPRLRA